MCNTTINYLKQSNVHALVCKGRLVKVLYMEKAFNFAGTTVEPFNTQNVVLRCNFNHLLIEIVCCSVLDKRQSSTIEKLGKIIIFYLYLSRISLIIRALIWLKLKWSTVYIEQKCLQCHDKVLSRDMKFFLSLSRQISHYLKSYLYN